ncbi:STAS domain-containing protein [Streptantibioticus silvisoli]|uniref:Anti-sigma factor antagonist n=1 Tax=Streptantibioticus silvisoli TaxID=2705255 RepID=A0ABT6W840_9ACTN|nr:STAS domain-containing protein [Streptantibioticus silvisoli]MDI5966469.1 STAS domain-containing protein [Streptantibioticus silvisoli]
MHGTELTVLADDSMSTGSVGLLRLFGELDQDSGAQLFTEVGAQAEAGRRWMVLECSQLVFCDSSGLNCLLRVRQLLDRQGGGLFLVRPQKSLALVLSITGIDQVLSVTGTVEEALQSTREEARSTDRSARLRDHGIG